MNWAYYSPCVGNIFGAPPAIEWMMAFFLEANLIGAFFVVWDRSWRVKHLLVTCFLALATSLPAVWILIASAWMRHPVGAAFNAQTMRMDITSFSGVVFNPMSQVKFVHTVSGGYVFGSMFVLSISAWYLLGGRNVDLAKRSMTVAVSFGLAAALSVVVLGDTSGYPVSQNQKPSPRQRRSTLSDCLTSNSGCVRTRPTPKPGNLSDFGWPVCESACSVHSGSMDQESAEIWTEQADSRLDHQSPTGSQATLAAHDQDVGYALLPKRYGDDPRQATPADIQKAVDSTIPDVPVLF
jgi:cytochrome d ubiquinol oxidase subunit I